MKKNSISINFIDIAFILFYSFDMLLLLLMKTCNNNFIAKLLACIILYSFLFIGIIKEKGALKADSIIVILTIYLLFLITGMIYPKYKYAIFELPSWNIYVSVFTFSSAIFAYLFFRLINDKNRMLEDLTKASYICFIWAIIRIISSIKNGGFSKSFENGIISTSTYDMAVGYRLLFCSIIYFISMKNKRGKKILYLLLMIVSTILMAFYGSRTSIISFILFIFLYEFCINEFDNRKSKLKKISFIIIIGILYILIFNTKSTQLLQTKLNEIGINSRILNTLSEKNIELDLGRNRMWTACIDYIKNNMIIGKGIYSDRYLFGIYCHQIFLEVFMDFGIFIGGFLIFIFLRKIFYMLFKCKDKEWKLLFIMFFSMIIIRLNVSSSFWQDTNFWACLAIIKNFFSSKKIKESK